MEDAKVSKEEFNSIISTQATLIANVEFIKDTMEYNMSRILDHHKRFDSALAGIPGDFKDLRRLIHEEALARTNGDYNIVEKLESQRNKFYAAVILLLITNILGFVLK